MVKTWVVVIITLFLIALTTLYIIGARAMANEPRLEGFGPEDAEQQTAAGLNFQPSVITQFMDAAMTGLMPGGVRTSHALFPREYFQYFSSKYLHWAPAPFKDLPPPAIPPLGPIPGAPMAGDSPPPIIRVAHAISGLDKMLSMAFSGQSITLAPSFKAMRARVWFGLPPMSEARWAAKGLDEEENIEEAMAVIQQAIDVFKYNLTPSVQGEMRNTHNKVWTEIDVFQDAIVALRAQRGESEPGFNVATLWQEYVKLHFKYMESQARAWAFKRLQILFQVWKDRTLRIMQSGRPINATQGTIRIDHWALMILGKLLDQYLDAEIFIRCRTDGYSLEHGIDQRLVGAITLEKTEGELNAIYGEIEARRVSDLNGVLASVLAARTAARRAESEHFPEFLEKPSLVFDREFSMRGLMKEMDAPLKLGVESWVEALADERVEKFGFVIYRNTYSADKQDWDKFQEQLEAGLNSGWDGVLDPENVKRKATLHWVDGKEEGIPEDDIDAIRTHFKAFAESATFPNGLNTATCLVITPLSFKSYVNTEPENRKGDYRGFLAVVDSRHDLEKADQREGEPGYRGYFNIIDQLVWTDLFALKENRSGQSAEEYWHLAAQHPWGVYIGPTTGELRKRWRLMGEGVKELAGLMRRQM